MNRGLEWKYTDSSGRTGKGDEAGGVAFYVNDKLECRECSLGMDEELTES